MPRAPRQEGHAASHGEEIDLDDICEDSAVNNRRGVSVVHHAGDAPSASESGSEDEDGISVPAARTVLSPVLEAAELKHREDDVVDCVLELRARGLGASDTAGSHSIAQKKRIATSRLGMHGRLPSGAVLQAVHSATPMQPLFDNAGDDIIKFSRSDDDEGGTSSDDGVADEVLQQRRRKKIDRDFDDAAEERLAAEDEDEEPAMLQGDGTVCSSGESSTSEGWEEDSDSDQSSEPSEEGSSTEEDDEDEPTSACKHHKPLTAAASSSAHVLSRAHYSGVTFESHYNRSSGSAAAFGCYHTLLGLTTAQTIRGPCAVFGVFNETSCNGFLLGKKHFVVGGAKDVAVLQPLQKMTSSSSQQSVGGLLEARNQRLNATDGLRYSVPHAGQAGQEDGCSQYWGVGAHSPEAMFGKIDWDWVAGTLQSWLSRLAADKSMSVVLVVQSYQPGELMTRRVQFKTQGTSHVDRYGSGDSMLIPACFAKKHVPPPVEPALLPVFRKIMMSAQSVAVVGGQNIGKSTLARAITNGFLSQQGICYWVDMDLGRPEFGVSGSLSISRVHRPLWKENEVNAVSWVKVIHVGGARMQCPETMAQALDHFCAFVDAHHGTWLRPLVINTHGWIQSSGRRATVEALRRIRPQHVIQLMRHGDPKWVMPEVIFEPSCGLNRRVVAERFRCGISCVMPEALGLRNASGSDEPSASANPQMNVHSIVVVRLEAHQKSKDLRKDNWRSYFKPLTDSALGGEVAVLEISLSGGGGGRGPVLVMPHDSAEGGSIEEFVSMTAHSVVALCTISKVTQDVQMGRKREREPRDVIALKATATVRRPQDILRSAEFLCYGFVVTSWRGDAAGPSNSIRVAVPLPQKQLLPLFKGNPDNKQLAIYACPFESVDTSFIIQQPAT